MKNILKLEIEGFTPQETEKYMEILQALLQSGGLSGVKSGTTTLHFDQEGRFSGIELSYWPWRRRKTL